MIGNILETQRRIYTYRTKRINKRKQNSKNKLYRNIISRYRRCLGKNISGENNMQYKDQMFNGGVETECGNATSLLQDLFVLLIKKVYMDLTFFNELKTRFRDTRRRFCNSICNCT
jgi:predicted metalloprotease